jgi:predicted ArsR family transcriptional regulator
MSTKHTPLTSRLSYKEVVEDRLDQRIQVKIMRALYKLKGNKGIKTQIAQKLKVPEETIHKRFSELERKGAIEKTGRMFKSKRTGKWQQEWQLTGTPEQE